MRSTSTDVTVPKSGSAQYRTTDKTFMDRLRQLTRRWPMAVISVGVISSFVWAVLLVWLLLGVVNRLL
jgi:hypothetical protein